MDDEDNAKLEVEKEDSPLFQAITLYDSAYDILTIIDRYPAAARLRSTNGIFPLHQACIDTGGDPRGLVIMKLLDLFPQAAQEKYRYGDGYDDYVDHYPLHIACRKLCDDVILKLIDVYPDAAQINNKEKRIDYPLHIALYHSRSDRVIMKLMDVFPEAVASKTVLDGDMNPLHIACKVGRSKQVIQKLLEIYPMALHEQSSRARWSSDGYPLGWAMENNQSFDVIKLLVTTDPSILQQADDHGWTPLHKACYWNLENVVEHLFQFPDLPINARTNRGDTPLHVACHYGGERIESVIEMILEHPDIDVNAVNFQGESAIHMIIEEHRFRLIDLLLSHPCIRIDQKDNENQTPLDLINKQIIELTNDNDKKKSSLPHLMRIRMLLQDFPVKRKWQSYEYFHQNIEDCSSRKTMKK